MFDFIITGYRWIFLQMASVLGPGWAIVALSFICSALMAPLMKAVGGIVRRETDYQSVINPQLDAIKIRYASDMERHLHIQRLYSRYSYSPLSAIKKVMPLFVQIPFLLLTYYMLKGTTELNGVSFGFLSDLGNADGLLSGKLLPVLFVEGRGLVNVTHSFNLLPLIMTGVNVLTVFSTPGFSHRDRRQAIAISLLFFVLLYAAPSGLLLYWTLNNLITFARTLIENRCAGAKLLKTRIWWLRNLPALTHSFISESANQVSYFSLLFSAIIFFTAKSLSFLPEACHGQTYTLSIGVMILLLTVASGSTMLSLSKQPLMIPRFVVMVCLIPCVVLPWAIAAIFAFKRSYFWIVINQVNLFDLYVLLLLLNVLPFLFCKATWSSSWASTIQYLRSNWFLFMIPVAMAIHYSFSSEGFHLPIISVCLLVVYMLLPCVIFYCVCSLLFRDALSVGCRLGASVGVCVGAYVLPMILHDTGTMAFDRSFFLRMLVIVAVVCLFIKYHSRRSFKLFTVILFLIVVINSVLASKQDLSRAPIQSRDDTRRFLANLSCVKTNNVYLLIYDGYAHRIERNALKLDGAFVVEDYLKEKGFTVYDAYSIGSGTVESMSQVFTIANISGETDRSTMAGDSLFCDFLKNAGYRTSFVLCGYAMPGNGVRKPGDYYFPSAQAKTRPELVLLPCIWRGYLSRTPNTFNAYTHEEWLAEKGKVIDQFSLSKNFIYAHSGKPGHACREPSDKGPIFRDINTRAYREWLLDANQEIRHDIEKIVAKDPNAIVIVASDHGAQLMMPDENSQTDARHLLDRLGVLLCVRWPDGYQPKRRLYCLQNVLLEVMMYLADDQSLERFSSKGVSNAIPWPISIPRGFVCGGVISKGSDSGRSIFQAAESKFREQDVAR